MTDVPINGICLASLYLLGLLARCNRIIRHGYARSTLCRFIRWWNECAGGHVQAFRRSEGCRTVPENLRSIERRPHGRRTGDDRVLELGSDQARPRAFR